MTAVLYSIGAYYYYKETKLSIAAALFLFLFRVILAILIMSFLLYFNDNSIRKISRIAHVPREDNNKEVSTLRAMIEFAIAYSPLLIIKYPGAMCWDTWMMLNQYRTNTISTHHSVLYSVVLGKAVQFFEAQGNANIGLFMIVLFQYFLMTISFGYAVNTISRMGGANHCTILIIKIMWIANPYVLEYVGVAMKDVPYFSLMVILTTMLIDIRLDKAEFFKNMHKPFLFCATVVLASLVRKNGIYVIVALLLAAITRKALRKNTQPLIFVLLISIFLFAAINTCINSAFNAEKASISEALSIPFQQTARYVKYHGDDVEEKEKLIIDSVLEYDLLAKNYDPQKSDYVKGTYKEDATQLPKYFGVWVKHLTRHPMCYFSAYCEQYYYAFFPKANVDNIVIYQDESIGYEATKVVDMKKTVFFEPIFNPPQKLKALKEWSVKWLRGMHYNWVIGFFSNIAINVYIAIILFLVMIKKRKQCLLEFTPTLIALILALAGPAIYGHPRYLLPIVYTVPIMVMFYLHTFNESG